MAEFDYDPENDRVYVINETEVANSDVFSALSDVNPEVAALVRWTSDIRGGGHGHLGTGGPRRHGGLFDRDRYVTPHSVYHQFLTAYDAAENDDVVSGVIESTESLAFSKMSIECDDEDETNVWNQIAADLDLDSRLREMWRETFTVSQFYAGIWWGDRDYKVRGSSDKGVKRKRVFPGLRVPIGVTILDPLKIVPVGNMLFNQDKLCYHADNGEMDVIQAVINGDRDRDPMIAQLMVAPYEPDETERRMLGEEGLPSDRLYLLNPRNVWRHTDTRSQYQRFATVRLKSVFELLDLKHQLRQMDRAHLVGGTNFLVLVKKGSDAIPAKPAEVQNLQAQVRTLARVPVIVGDHRLSVEIVTPQTDNTLDPERYNGIDSRIHARLYQMLAGFPSGGGGGGRDSALDVAKVVGRGLESRRHMLRRSIEHKILKPAYDANDDFSEMPSFRFHPKRVALDFDPTMAAFLLDLRDRGDLSRESILEEIDYDQTSEFKRRKIEKERFDDVFQTTVPYSGGQPGQQDPRTAGRRQGGNRNGGGAAPGTGQGKAPVNPADTTDDN